MNAGTDDPGRLPDNKRVRWTVGAVLLTLAAVVALLFVIASVMSGHWVAF